MTDYKRLCAELVDAIDSGIPTDRMHLSPLMLRVRDALAEPEPQRRYIYSPVQIAECGGPCKQGPEHCDCGELWVTEPEPKEPTSRQLMMLADDMGMASVGDAAEYAHAVLARWGNHPGFPDSSMPQPVPVNERLPGSNDCDAKGKCWAWKLDDEDDAWHLELQEWINSPWTTHWLPANALPQPS